MAAGRMEFYSKSMMQHVNISFVLPNDYNMEEIRKPEYYDRPAKTVILLHGLTGTDTDWLSWGMAQEMAKQYHLAIFMPGAANYFYLDHGYSGGNHASLVGEELPAYIRKTFGGCRSREDTIIAGLSMGGFGAVHTALAYPETFGCCIALSSAFVIHEVAETGGRNDDVMPAAMIRDVFGDPQKILSSDKNPEVLYRKLKAEGKKIPGIYLAIGTEDGLYSCNQEFRSFLEKEEADFFYEEGPGDHNWDFWNPYFQRGMEWALGRKQQTK